MLAGILSVASLASFAACSDSSSDSGSNSGNNSADGGAATTTTQESAEAVTTTEKTEWTGDLVDVEVGEEDFDTSVDISGKSINSTW